jgi:hypothetical protein
MVRSRASEASAFAIDVDCVTTGRYFAAAPIAAGRLRAPAATTTSGGVMKRLFAFGAIGVFAVLVAGPAGAQTDDELKCEINASKVVAKFVKAKAKCLQKCWSAERKGDPVDCLDTAADGDQRDTTTQTCIDAAETKSNEGQAKKCTADCPECYEGGDCPADAQEKTDTTEGLVDTQDENVHCDNTTGTDDEFKCQAGASKSLAKLVGALAKCSQKCKAAEAKGTTTGSCAPPIGGGSDAALVTCVDAATAKCVAGLDKKCGTVGVTPPCWTATGIDTGTEWCNSVKTIVNSQYNEFFCEAGSASGAFLD